MHVETVKNAA